MTVTIDTTNGLPPIAHVETLAGDLIRALAEHAGDDRGVCAVLNRWNDELGTRDLSLVCMAAMRATFGECLTMTPLDQIPADRLALLPNLPNERKPA